MHIKAIPLTDLHVNPANDRHGDLADEAKAIQWLLDHRSDHMRNLTKDIVEEGQVYEPPLVHDDGGTYVVYDGNRRTTCLKLLAAPHTAPSEEWRKFFAKQRAEWKPAKFPDKIQCQVEADRDRIDEILYRRHTGGQSGVGQSQWDAEAKANFVQRTGKKEKLNVAEEIELKLREAGYLQGTKKLPRSNLNRLLSSESLRNRVGLSLSKNKLQYTHDEGKVAETLSRIAGDLTSKKVVLEDIWSNHGKKLYLDALEKEGVLPSANDSLSKPQPFKTLKSAKHPDQPVEPKPASKPKERTTLIRQIDYGVEFQSHTQRAMDIWTELQHRLHFGAHNNAIAVLFRVLLEISIDNYVSRKSVASVHENDKLAKRFRKVIDHMLTDGSIDKSAHQALTKFENTEPIFSANTMHKYVHHGSFFPSDHHLKSMWDNLAQVVVICLKA